MAKHRRPNTKNLCHDLFYSYHQLFHIWIISRISIAFAVLKSKIFFPSHFSLSLCWVSVCRFWIATERSTKNILNYSTKFFLLNLRGKSIREMERGCSIKYLSWVKKNLFYKCAHKTVHSAKKGERLKQLKIGKHKSAVGWLFRVSIENILFT